MRPFDQHTHFLGFDWASEHHDAAVVDRQGRVVTQFRFEESSQGWQHFRERIREFPVLAVAIETSSGPTVDRLLDAGLAVFPVQPLAAKSYRERKAPSGVKDDQLDAWSLADALRTDGHGWRTLKPEDPLVLELRLLCRDEHGLIEQRTTLVLQLQAALRDYYPAALDAFDNWAAESAWDFLEAFPTPGALQSAGPKSWKKFLKTHQLTSAATLDKRQQLFAQASAHKGTIPTIAAKSRLARTLVHLLRTLETDLKLYRKNIQDLYDRHPDRDWFGSLPINHDAKTAPRLLAELGTDRDRFDCPNALQCQAGTAPVRVQTGKSRKGQVRRRLACNKYMQFATHWFSDLSRRRSAWAEAYYKKKRDDGHGHASALRCLGNRWMKILWQMWQTRTPYDPELHQRNQLKHGSWVLQLMPSTACAKPQGSC